MSTHHDSHADESRNVICTIGPSESAFFDAPRPRMIDTLFVARTRTLEIFQREVRT